MHRQRATAGFQKPYPVASNQDGPHGAMRKQDRLPHHEGLDPYQTGIRALGHSHPAVLPPYPVLRACGPPYALALQPSNTDRTIVGVSTHDGASSLGGMCLVVARIATAVKCAPLASSADRFVIAGAFVLWYHDRRWRVKPDCLQFPENAGGESEQGHGEPRIVQCFQWEVKALQVTVTLRGRRALRRSCTVWSKR